MSSEIISAACQLLIWLERNPDGDLPVPQVMHRITNLLSSRIQLTGEVSRLKKTELHSAFNYQELLKNPSFRLEGSIGEFVKAIWLLEAMDKPVYVDVQCLRSTEGEVIKEFSASCEGGPTAWVLVKSPPGAQPHLEDNEYLRDRIHGIYWCTGFIEENTLRSITKKLFSGTRQLRIKGVRKVSILVEKLDISRQCVDVLFDCPKLKDLCATYKVESCAYHQDMDKNLQCAMKITNALVCNYMAW